MFTLVPNNKMGPGINSGLAVVVLIVYKCSGVADLGSGWTDWLVRWIKKKWHTGPAEQNTLSSSRDSTSNALPPQQSIILVTSEAQSEGYCDWRSVGVVAGGTHSSLVG